MSLPFSILNYKKEEDKKIEVEIEDDDFELINLDKLIKQFVELGLPYDTSDFINFLYQNKLKIYYLNLPVLSLAYLHLKNDTSFDNDYIIYFSSLKKNFNMDKLNIQLEIYKKIIQNIITQKK